MNHFLSDIFETVFKPGAAVFAVAVALAVISFDQGNTQKSVSAAGMFGLTCSDLLKPVCGR